MHYKLSEEAVEMLYRAKLLLRIANDIYCRVHVDGEVLKAARSAEEARNLIDSLYNGELKNQRPTAD